VSRAGVALAGTAGLAALLFGVTACTSTKAGLPSTTSSSAASSATDTAPTDTSTPTDPATSDTPTPTPTGSATPSPSATLPKGTCTGAQLTVRVLRGGADAGREIALITFTNSSSAACSMFGFPGVSLRLNDAILGRPADRMSLAPTTVRLAPGEQGQAQITDYSSCQAPLSDTVRVYPPNLTSFVDRPIQLRGCLLVVAPVTHS
jgi:hypothetical protein